MMELLDLLHDMGYDLNECHVTAKGQILRISEMSNEHLVNCIRCCKTDRFEPKAYWESRLPKFAAELMRRAQAPQNPLPRTRNEKILIEIEDFFYGTIAQFEDNFGYLSAMDDEQVIEFIKSNYREYPIVVKEV